MGNQSRPPRTPAARDRRVRSPRPRRAAAAAAESEPPARAVSVVHASNLQGARADPCARPPPAHVRPARRCSRALVLSRAGRGSSFRARHAHRACCFVRFDKQESAAAAVLAVHGKTIPAGAPHARSLAAGPAAGPPRARAPGRASAPARVPSSPRRPRSPPATLPCYARRAVPRLLAQAPPRRSSSASPTRRAAAAAARAEAAAAAATAAARPRSTRRRCSTR